MHTDPPWQTRECLDMNRTNTDTKTSAYLIRSGLGVMVRCCRCVRDRHALNVGLTSFKVDILVTVKVHNIGLGGVRSESIDRQTDRQTDTRQPYSNRVFVGGELGLQSLNQSLQDVSNTKTTSSPNLQLHVLGKRRFKLFVVLQDKVSSDQSRHRERTETER
jgi:hypothetical protein